MQATRVPLLNFRMRHATALRVTRPSPAEPAVADAQNILSTASGSGYGELIEYQTNLAAEQIEQDRHPLAVLHAIEQAKTVCEHAIQYADLFAARELRPLLEPDKALRVLARLETLDDCIRDRNRILAVGHQPRHADRRMNRAPALADHIDGDEQIAREQWRGNRLDPARVAPTLEIARQIGRKSLTSQVADCLRLGMGVGLHNIPALAHSAASGRASGRNPSSFGTNTRSAPTRSTARSRVARAERTSVTTTASNAGALSKSRTTGRPTKVATFACGSTT